MGEHWARKTIFDFFGLSLLSRLNAATFGEGRIGERLIFAGSCAGGGRICERRASFATFRHLFKLG